MLLFLKEGGVAAALPRRSSSQSNHCLHSIGQDNFLSFCMSFVSVLHGDVAGRQRRSALFESMCMESTSCSYDGLKIELEGVCV